jgi:hypothetical protein
MVIDASGIYAEYGRGNMKHPAVRKRRFWFYAGAALVVVLVVAYQYYMQHKAQVFGAPIVELSALQQRQLEAFLGMNQLLIALGTGLLGAMGFLLANTGKARSSPRELWPAAGSAVFVGLSLYFGYKGYDDILFMLQPPNSTFDLYAPLTFGDRVAHFVTLAIGVFLFADFAFHELSQEGAHEQLDDVKNA